MFLALSTLCLALPLSAAARRSATASDILADPQADPIARRQAFHRLCALDPDKADDFLRDPDIEIRLQAYYRLTKQKGAAALEQIATALDDESIEIRSMAVKFLVSLAKQNKEASELLARVAREESDVSVRQIADQALWPFHRETLRLSQDPDWDHTVTNIHSFELPGEDWSFKTDPQQQGHKKGWYETKFNDKNWAKIKQGYWEPQGYADYDGVAWYRIRFQMPEKMDSNAVELAFGAVDESAWVWLNGVFLGAHDIGPEGWNLPFNLDCREEVRWGEENLLVVRVLDTYTGGGIWKPISIEILK